MKKYGFLFVFLLLGVILLIPNTACRKKGKTLARIIVRDTGNFLVPGAEVIIYGVSTETPIKPVVRRDTLYTNIVGEVLFDFDEIYQLGQAGVAVLDITAEKGDMWGEGIIKIEEEVENTTTVFIQP